MNITKKTAIQQTIYNNPNYTGIGVAIVIELYKYRLHARKMEGYQFYIDVSYRLDDETVDNEYTVLSKRNPGHLLDSDDVGYIDFAQHTAFKLPALIERKHPNNRVTEFIVTVAQVKTDEVVKTDEDNNGQETK